MKSKLALSLMIVPCLGVLVASAVAQTFQSTTTAKDPPQLRTGPIDFVPDAK